MTTQEFGPGVVIIDGKEYVCTSFKISTQDRMREAADKVSVAFGGVPSSVVVLASLSALGQFSVVNESARSLSLLLPEAKRKTAQWKSEKRKFR